MTVLKGMTWEHERGYNSVAESAKAYAKLKPDVRVEWEYRSLQAFADEPIENMATRYDLMVIDHPHVPLAAESGLLARLDGRGYDDQLKGLAQQSVGLSHESYNYNQHQYGLATDVAAHVSVYRPDLLETPPQTWDEVLELAREGKVLWPYKPIDAFSSLITLATSFGEPPMAQPGTFLSAETAKTVLPIMRTLAEHVPTENANWNPIQVADALSTEDRWSYCPMLFGYSNYSRERFRPHRLAYTDIPHVKGAILGGAGIAVSAHSPHIDEAIAYALWLASAEVQEGVYYDAGGQPGNSFAWESDRTNEDSLNFFRGTRATLENAYLRPRSPGYMALQDNLSPLVTEALTGGLSDEELLERLNSGVQKYLEEHS